MEAILLLGHTIGHERSTYNPALQYHNTHLHLLTINHKPLVVVSNLTTTRGNYRLLNINTSKQMLILQRLEWIPTLDFLETFDTVEPGLGLRYCICSRHASKINRKHRLERQLNRRDTTCQGQAPNAQNYSLLSATTANCVFCKQHLKQYFQNDPEWIIYNLQVASVVKPKEWIQITLIKFFHFWSLKKIDVTTKIHDGDN